MTTSGDGARRAGDDRPSVELQHVTKRFGDFTAVRDLDLAFGRGEFFTLLGPSGCGKTTTLRMVAGFERPTAGRVLIDGTPVDDLPPFRRPTNTVFQSYALFPHLSVEDNVAFGLRRKRVPKQEVRRRVAAELERVGLAREAKRKPRQLSGGQQQRVALARALINLPTVLLLDEPLGALDLKLRKGLQIELKRIQREVGITFIYVTHDQEEALTMSDRIAVMNHGVIEQLDIPEAVYERPRTTFVAGFIGVSNLMPAAVVSANGAAGELRLDAGVQIRAAGMDGLAVGERCSAVVRPEKLRIQPASPVFGDTWAGGVRALRRQPPGRRGHRRELAVLRYGDAVRGPAAGRRRDDGAGAERGRGRPPGAARRRRPCEADVGRRAHARRARGGVGSGERTPRRERGFDDGDTPAGHPGANHPRSEAK